MNNDYYSSQTHMYQLLGDTIRVYNENIRLSQQQMSEYNRNMRDLIVILRETLRSQRIRRPMRDPPPTPIRRPFTLPRHLFSNIVRNYNHEMYSGNSVTGERLHEETQDSTIHTNANIHRRPRSRSLGEYIATNRINQNAISSESESEQLNSRNERRNGLLDSSANSNVRTFTPNPDVTLSTTFHNASRNSISTIYNLLRRDFDEIMGFHNFVETTDANTGLTEEEKEIGLLDISYNSEIHDLIDTRCPISLDDFEEEETIIQIVECGHIFKTHPIMTWFERHTECPKCRCQLRISNSSRHGDISFNVVTPLQNMDADDVEREIDELTRRVTNSMIEDINRNVEISIGSRTVSTNLPDMIRERYISSQRTNITNRNHRYQHI